MTSPQPGGVNCGARFSSWATRWSSSHATHAGWGLLALGAVLRGAVRVEKNQELCHLSTIDWGLQPSPGANHIVGNKPGEECADVCPGLAWRHR